MWKMHQEDHKKSAKSFIYYVFSSGEFSWALSRGLGIQNERDNESVEPEDFGKDENQNHSDKEFRLIQVSSDASISNNANCVAACHARKTRREPGCEVHEPSIERVISRFHNIGNKDRDYESINSNDSFLHSLY